MAARPLQPSEYDIQREVEALKDLKRRSTNPAALSIDPDLPNQTSQTSPTSPYRSNRAFNPTDVASIESSGGIDTPDQAGTSDGSDAVDGPSDDPFHLFWVPASLHPEIAPAEFRAFLKEHARASPSEEAATLGRSFSSSSSLGRKKSMLSRPYKPKDTDADEEENIVPVRRNRSIYRNEGPQLTISDLQKLEELAEEASQSDDPSKLRNVLRRSLSLNVSPTAILLDNLPDMDDDADSPIVVPPRDKALRRTARTKIRKPGLPGDGGGHRFAASRRNKKSSQPAAAEQRTSSDLSASDHGEADQPPTAGRRTTLSEEDSSRPESGYSEEQSIFDAYAGQDDDEQTLPGPLGPFSPLEPFTISFDPTPELDDEVMASRPETTNEPPVLLPIIHQPQPQHLTIPLLKAEEGSPSRTPSPSPPSEVPRPQPIFPTPAPPGFVQSSPNLLSSPKKEKEKDKKGLFKWGDKSGKKANKEKDRPPEKESGFLFSIFGKKKQDPEYQSSMTGGTSGREAAQALLGASKSSKSHSPLSSPGLAPGIGGNPYARYPIHVERAIYRLSHIKLANPRRPLYEQVLISNLMFWYLGIINKAQTPPAPAPANGPAGTNTPQPETPDTEKEEQDQQQREKERERIEKERLEKERLEKEQREMEMKKKESGRRGSLTKAAVGVSAAGARRAEMPVKGPQYDIQHRVMEQEYGGYGAQQPRRSTSPGPPPMNGGSPGRRQLQTAPGQPAQGQPVYMGPPVPGRQPGRLMQPGPQVQSVVPQSRSPTEQYYYPNDNYQPQPQPRGLPPGAMPPVDKQMWMSQTNSSSPPPLRTPSPNAQARPEPSQAPYAFPRLHKETSLENLNNQNGAFNKVPVRSLSATASILPPHPNGDLIRSPSAPAPGVLHPKRPRTADSAPHGGEEEDLPLAVWQQQRRR